MSTAEMNDDQQRRLLIVREREHENEQVRLFNATNSSLHFVESKTSLTGPAAIWHELYILLWEMVIVMTAETTTAL